MMASRVGQRWKPQVYSQASKTPVVTSNTAIKLAPNQCLRIDVRSIGAAGSRRNAPSRIFRRATNEARSGKGELGQGGDCY